MSHPSSGYVFISYSRRDGDAMQRIVSFLRGQGVTAWVDNERLVPGTPIWEREIERAIRGALAVVVILSPDAKESVWVLNELTLADEYKKRVFPVLVAGDFRDSVPFRLVSRQFVDLRMNESAGLNLLIAALSRYLEELERLEAERLNAEGDAAERAEAERKSREEAARLAEWKAEQERIADEKRRAELRAKEAADHAAAQQSGREPQPVTLTKGQKLSVQQERFGQSSTAHPTGNDSAKPISPGATLTLPFSRSVLTWGIAGIMAVCALGAGIWGVSSWLRGLGSSPPTTTEEPTADNNGVNPPAPTEEPATEPAPTEDLSLPPFSGTSLVAPDCNYGGLFRSIEATDRYTVTFSLCKPEAAFLSKIALDVFGIYPEEWIATTAVGGTRTEDALRRPIGTGPYVVQQWQSGESITFQANPDYWGPTPNADTLIFRWSQDISERVSALQSSTVDGIADVSTDYYSGIMNDGSLSLKIRPSPNVLYIGINNNVSPFNDPRVRQALAMGIDRQRIVSNYFPPGSEVASYLAPCIVPNGCQGDPWYAYDPERAKQLLAEAGYPDGFTSNIYYRDVFRIYLPEAANIANDIQSQLKDTLNIELTPIVMNSADFLSAMFEAELEGLYLGGWTSDYPHITSIINPLFTPTNRQFGDNPYGDLYTLVEQGANSADAASIYTQVNNVIKNEVPLIPVAHGVSYTAFRADVDNQQASPMYQEQFALVRPNGRDTFIWMESGEPVSLFCADETDGYSIRACAQFIETLYRYQNDTGYVEPSLAEECVPNENLTVWVCTLRQGVVFHDGTTFDANDVVATFTMGLDASSPLHAGNTNTWDYYSLFWGLINSQ